MSVSELDRLVAKKSRRACPQNALEFETDDIAAFRDVLGCYLKILGNKYWMLPRSMVSFDDGTYQKEYETRPLLYQKDPSGDKCSLMEVNGIHGGCKTLKEIGEFDSKELAAKQAISLSDKRPSRLWFATITTEKPAYKVDGIVYYVSRQQLIDSIVLHLLDDSLEKWFFETLPEPDEAIYADGVDMGYRIDSMYKDLNISLVHSCWGK